MRAWGEAPGTNHGRQKKEFSKACSSQSSLNQFRAVRENLHEFRGVIKVNNNDRETSRESFSEQRLSEGIVSLYLSEYFTGLNMKNTKND